MEKNLKEIVIESLDGFDPELHPYISYLLQDLWEIGSSSKKLIEMIKKNNLQKEKLKIIDIGCGKGGISIPIAKEFDAEVYGIDAMPEFIEEANRKAKEWQVEKLCNFKQGDAREEIKKLNGFNLAVLASVGPVLGDVSQTLHTLESCLTNKGFVLLDDAYLPNNAVSDYTRSLRETEFFKQIAGSNFTVIDKLVHSPEDTAENDEYIYSMIEKRVKELSAIQPDKIDLFESYLALQKKENYSLENELMCVLLLLQKKY